MESKAGTAITVWVACNEKDQKNPLAGDQRVSIREKKGLCRICIPSTLSLTSSVHPLITHSPLWYGLAFALDSTFLCGGHPDNLG